MREPVADGVYDRDIADYGFQAGVTNMDAQGGQWLVRYRNNNSDPSVPALVFFGGYNHGSWVAWAWSIVFCILDFPNNIFVVERCQRGTDRLPKRLGWMRMRTQAKDAARSIKALQDTGWLFPGQKVSVCGHSMGGVYALKMAHMLPDLVQDVLVASSFTLLPCTLGLNLTGFWPGAWRALPTALKSIFWHGQGMIAPLYTVRKLFLRPDTTDVEAAAYARHLEPDSALAFPLASFVYGWLDFDLLWARLKGWKGQVHLIACTQDKCVPFWTKRLASWLYNAQLHALDEPHCWWVRAKEPLDTKHAVRRALWGVAGVNSADLSLAELPGPLLRSGN